MTRFVLTAVAADDVRAIHRYVAEASGARAAGHVRVGLRDAMRKLAKHPTMGYVDSRLAGPEVRFWPVWSYLIVYRPTDRPVTVLRVLHGAQDLSRALG